MQWLRKEVVSFGKIIVISDQYLGIRAVNTTTSGIRVVDFIIMSHSKGVICYTFLACYNSKCKW
jgi:hypothetical protein